MAGNGNGNGNGSGLGRGGGPPVDFLNPLIDTGHTPGGGCGDGGDDGHDDGHDGGPSFTLIMGTDGNDRLQGDVDATNLNDRIIAKEGDDRLYGYLGDDYLIGGPGSDRLYGDEGNDTLIGGTGDDDLFGGDGNDTLTGGQGDDILRGGDGDDILRGGQGTNRLYGGGGNNTFVLCTQGGLAEIYAFNPSEDVIRIHGIDEDLLSISYGKGNSTLEYGDRTLAMFMGQNIISLDQLTIMSGGGGHERLL
jgi:Ca2+-binding RTX toxin-like protein